jgi:DDE family transposase
MPAICRGRPARGQPEERREAPWAAPKDHQWQAQSGEGFTVQDFLLDWDREVAICPAGPARRSWGPDYHQGRTAFKVRFWTTDCRPCSLKTQCTRSERRLLTLRPREEHETLEEARTREAQPAFSKEYQQRAGIKGTISAGIRTLYLRRSRYIGLAKTHLQHVLTAAAMNLVRLDAWFAGTPRRPLPVTSTASTIPSGVTRHWTISSLVQFKRPVR